MARKPSTGATQATPADARSTRQLEAPPVVIIGSVDEQVPGVQSPGLGACVSLAERDYSKPFVPSVPGFQSIRSPVKIGQILI